jgi:hypothetical protein
VAVETDVDGKVRIVSTASSKHQSLIDAELHTAFGGVLNESDLQTARVHYANAKRMVREGDYPNAAKEAMCSVEVSLDAHGGERPKRGPQARDQGWTAEAARRGDREALRVARQ